MICMSKKEAAALDIGDKVEILSYPEIVEAAFSLGLISAEKRDDILHRFSRSGFVSAVRSPTFVGFISDMFYVMNI